jgi:hypothetical protein
MRVSDGMGILVAKVGEMTEADIAKRLKFLADDELRLFAGTRDAGFDEYDAIERAMQRNRDLQKVLRDRLREIRS